MKCLLLATIFCFIAIVAEGKYLGLKNTGAFRPEVYNHRLKRQTFSSTSSSSSSSATSGNGPTKFHQISSTFHSQGPVGNGNLESRLGEENEPSSSGHISITSGVIDPITHQYYINQSHHEYPYYNYPSKQNYQPNQSA